MTLIRESHMGVGEDWGFSLYFLAHVPAEQADKCKEEGEVNYLVNYLL